MRRVFQFMMKTVISNYSLVEIASVTDLPYVVLVETSLRICFGVLIDALWVLTVAHCFGPLRTAMVVAGTTHWEKSNNKIQSYEVIIHPDYKKTKNIFQESSDLALIRVRQADIGLLAGCEEPAVRGPAWQPSSLRQQTDRHRAETIQPEELLPN
ncbi:uncharacterized protein isoform X2 [Rhodnius prolixus]|uniref:uncharacterized protein isoform X2 n=1 Tax=Rhodnius prolixus TaxID=13249 RepID=UPI003D18BAF9